MKQLTIENNSVATRSGIYPFLDLVFIYVFFCMCFSLMLLFVHSIITCSLLWPVDCHIIITYIIIIIIIIFVLAFKFKNLNICTLTNIFLS